MAIGHTTLTMQVERTLVNELEELRKFRGARSRAEVARQILHDGLRRWRVERNTKE